ncbi:hypothetical protein FOZ62_028955, partial [Perkinsus olseni]
GSDRLSVYYNSAFDLADPIGSGDLWYLVNHSDRPNTRILGLRDGLAVKAIREISRGEPITWRYPLEYFGEDDFVVSLPRVINGYPEIATPEPVARAGCQGLCEWNEKSTLAPGPLERAGRELIRLNHWTEPEDE